MLKLKVNDKFQELIPPLSMEEYKQLEDNIIEEGCRDALVVWNGYIVDGHNRYEICQMHDIPFKTVERSFDSEEDVLDWIDKNQLGRRNLTPDQMRLLRGRRYNRLKKGVGEHSGNQYTRMENDQNEPISTAEKLAKDHGVSSPTIRRDGKLYSQIEELKPRFPEEVKKVLSGQAPIKSVFDAKRASEKVETPWTESELKRKQDALSGQTVVANIYKDVNLIEWAKGEGLYQRIDRMTKWGNPFEIPGDGDREEVCRSYEIYYGLKKSLHSQIDELRGKVLGCHCYPEQCHGDFLKGVADNED